MGYGLIPQVSVGLRHEKINKLPVNLMYQAVGQLTSPWFNKFDKIPLYSPLPSECSSFSLESLTLQPYTKFCISTKPNNEPELEPPELINDQDSDSYCLTYSSDEIGEDDDWVLVKQFVSIMIFT